MSEHNYVKIASTQEHYEKYGVKPGIVEPHEDGIHTDGMPGNYEWWYFDSNLEDDANLVITFQTKPFTSSHLPLTPMVSVDFNNKNGGSFSKMYTGTSQDFSASDECCDVVIGTNTFKGNLENYTIHTDIEGITVDVEIERMIPSWRPGAGTVLYGQQEEFEYGWLVAVPKGKVTATITENGVSKTYHGYGYHDHNWGNKNLVELKHHGYWGRAELDGYTFINAINYAPASFGKEDFTMFMLADSEHILADDSSKVTFESSNVFVDEVTQKPIARNISYTYEDGNKKYRIAYEIENVILQVNMVDALPKEQKEAALKAGMNPSYLRYTGSVELDIFDDGQLTEHHRGNAIWESMYFGNPDEF